ncbi:hypothetical protein ACFPIF_05375 [Brevundimonas faecalis]|uniref:hypothetical protein n=1 Tax=Brevundimonas faecalis TaxID=947378 RepID=UPI003612378F
MSGLPLQPGETAPVLFEISRLDRVWRLASSDGLFFGLFQSRAAALRCAVEEADRRDGGDVLLHARD